MPLSSMQGEGIKALKRPHEDHPNSATGIKALKRPHEDHPNSATVFPEEDAYAIITSPPPPPEAVSFAGDPSYEAAVAPGAKAEVTGGSIFKPPSMDSSAYDASGEVKGKCPCVENLSSASATAAASVTKAQVSGRSISIKPPSVDYADAYVYDATEVRHRVVYVGGRRTVKQIFQRHFSSEYDPNFKDPNFKPVKAGIVRSPIVPSDFWTKTPSYRKAVAKGLKVEISGNGMKIELGPSKCHPPRGFFDPEKF